MKKELDLGKEKINKLLMAFAIPCIISMLINSVYNIVDQIFIGQGVGYVGNAATNVIFPLVIVCNAIAQLLGNGCAAGLSLKLGEGKRVEAKKSVGSSISMIVIVSIVFSIISYIFLPELVNLFGCTETVYPYAIAYGKIILFGAPFMIMYTGIAAIIRADGSPRYSMVCLLVGAIINLILDPIFIFDWGLGMGVEGGALATIIGQIVSAIIALCYIPKIKSVDLEKKDFIPNKSIFKILGYGASSFITQMTVLVLFVYMNNIMTKFGAMSKFGADIPLSVYGVASKLNNLYVSAVLGIAIGAQPILGFNYGAGNFERVKEVLKKVLIINFIIGAVFNLAMVIFPTQIVSLFGSADDLLYLEFATDFCRIFLMLSILNAFEMSASIVIQSLGNVKKATFVAFARQIILFIPISLVLTQFLGLYGALYGGPIADAICFVIVIFVYGSEHRKIGKEEKFESHTLANETKKDNILKDQVIITINRQYGSGGRYIGKMVAEKLGIKFYDKDLIRLVSEQVGMTEKYIEENEQKRNVLDVFNNGYYVGLNNADELFIKESEFIKKVASEESCIIVGRCADFILKDNKNTIKIFINNSMENKVKRATEFYHMNKEKAEKEISRINKLRANHYKYYTEKDWKEPSNYDICINSDAIGIDNAVNLICDMVKNLIK